MNKKLSKMIESRPVDNGLFEIKPAEKWRLIRPEREKRKRQRIDPTPRQWEVIYLHLNGKTRDEIADEMGVAPATVTMWLNDERSMRVMQDYFNHLDLDLRALFAKVVFSMKDLMESPDPHVRLKTIDVWNRMHGKYSMKVDLRTSAEDIVGKLMGEV